MKRVPKKVAADAEQTVVLTPDEAERRFVGLLQRIVVGCLKHRGWYACTTMTAEHPDGIRTLYVIPEMAS